MKYINELRNGIENEIKFHNTFIIGEDVQDPYGGAFKVTKGLSTLYPNNIIAVPMCEQGFFGMGVGMAFEGSYVVVESMFGDFVTLMADQMINHAAKFSQMYKESMRIVLRCPSGGYKGYGATHSQSLERIYFGIPGVQIVAPSIAHSPGKLLEKALDSGIPTVFVESKSDYPRELLGSSGLFWEKEMFEEDGFPIARIKVKNEKPDYTIIVYGGLVQDALDVMEYFLYEEEMNIDIVIPSNLSEIRNIADFVRCRNVLIIEEGVRDFGWGAEVACHFLESGVKVQRAGAENSFIPASGKWEHKVLLQKEDIIQVIQKGMK